jgi:hypothetical protein
MRTALAGIALGLMLAAGCGGSEDAASPPLRNGVYEYELTPQYLLDNGISEFQAESESGVHRTTLDGKDFVDTWKTAAGRTGSCRGTFEADGTLVTFRWTSGCWGDWEMRYRVDGTTVTWSDVEALPPYDTEEDQKVSEVFSGVPWTRIGNPPKKEE